MNERLRRLTAPVAGLREGRIPIGLAKARLVTESWRSTVGQPVVTRTAAAFAHLLAHAPIHIGPDELIVGNPTSQPWGVELTHLWGLWPADEVDALLDAGFVLPPDGREEIEALNGFWAGQTLTSRMTQLYDDEHLWPYAQLGIVLPAFRSREEGWGAGGLLGGGYGIQHEISQFIGVPDYAKVLHSGLRSLVDEAERELRANRLFSADSIEKRDHLRAVVVSLNAVIGFADRFADLAQEQAERCADPVRRAELTQIAATCRQVPAGPARTFAEAVQSYWFLFLMMLPSGVLGMGRLDQLLYPFYRKDIEAGRLTDDAAVERLACLRVRDMEVTITGSAAHRGKWAGGSKWHNCVIGGQLADGTDATNPLSYLILDAALAAPVPHHTITLRVHSGTPEPLLHKALTVARTGLGMPAFVGDPAMIDYLTRDGIPLEVARDYTVAGCLSVGLTGDSRAVACPMFVTPRVLEIALAGGVDPRTGTRVGPATPRLADLTSYDELFAALREHLAHFLALQAEFNNVTIQAIAERFPRPVESALMNDGIASGRDHLNRTLRYENGNMVNPIGLVNVVDSLAAIRHLVFPPPGQEAAVTPAELAEALASNWAGADHVRQLCLAAPKYGNDDDRADAIAVDLFRVVAELARGHGTAYGGSTKVSALTIGTSSWPGGALTGATPDGRWAGEQLAEESLTPMRGRELHGPWEVIRSALKVDQSPYQTTELDLRFSPEALADDDALRELATLIHTYVDGGGKHVQLNVVDPAAVLAANRGEPDHAETIVRLGGSSAYARSLSPALAADVAARNHFHGVAIA